MCAETSPPPAFVCDPLLAALRAAVSARRELLAARNNPDVVPAEEAEARKRYQDLALDHLFVLAVEELGAGRFPPPADEAEDEFRESILPLLLFEPVGDDGPVVA